MGEIYVFIKQEIEEAVDELIKKAVAGKSYTLGLKRDEIDARNQLVAADWLGSKLVPKFLRLGKKLSFLQRHKKFIQVKKSVKAPGLHKFTVETSLNVHTGKLNLTPPNAETGLEDGASPARVVQTGLMKPPVGCDFELFDSALRLLRKPKTFLYLASSNSWEVDLPGRKGRATAGGWEFKLDPEGQWRVTLGLKHDVAKNELLVNVLSAKGPKVEPKAKEDESGEQEGEEGQSQGRGRSNATTERPNDDGPQLKNGQSPRRVHLIGVKDPRGCPARAHGLALRALQSPDSFQWDASGKRWTLVAANKVMALTSRSFTLQLDEVEGGTWVFDLLWKYDAEKEQIVVKIDACRDSAKPKPEKTAKPEEESSTESESEGDDEPSGKGSRSTKPTGEDGQGEKGRTSKSTGPTPGAKPKVARPANGANPRTVALKGLRQCPEGCEPGDFERVLKELADPKSYKFARSDDRYAVALSRNVGNPAGDGWEIDVKGLDGSGTVWTMLLAFKHDRKRDDLTVTVRSCTAD